MAAPTCAWRRRPSPVRRRSAAARLWSRRRVHAPPIPTLPTGRSSSPARRGTAPMACAPLSAKHIESLPGQACVDFSIPAGFAPPMLRIASRSAPPIVALAFTFAAKAGRAAVDAQPGSDRPTHHDGERRAASRAGSRAAWNCDCNTARTVASTTEKLAGSQPAMTALAATFSAVTTCR